MRIEIENDQGRWNARYVGEWWQFWVFGDLLVYHASTPEEALERAQRLLASGHGEKTYFKPGLDE